MVRSYLTANEFLNDTEAHLYKKEDEYALLLGMVETSRQMPAKNFSPIFLQALNFAQRFAGAFVQTRKGNGLITDCGEIAIKELVQFLAENQVVVTSLMGPAESSETFAYLLAEKSSLVAELAQAHNILKLTAVDWPEDCGGKPIVANQEHFGLVYEWLKAFYKEVAPKEVFDQEFWQDQLKVRLSNQQIYFWQHNHQLTACCQVGQPSRQGFRVSFVYTPKEHRGKGYASNLVACACQDQLAQGKLFCTLNADKGNSSTHRLYEKLGFNKIAESAFYLIKSKS
jgi:ribosomal protein S18 acetylase RimI-like enzyme